MLELGWFKRWRIIAAGLLLLVAGCSTLRLAYNQADSLTYWWLDGYVDFTPAQAPRARDAIAAWFDWNRRSQLADYAALLDTAAEEVLQDTTPARVCEWLHEVRVRLDRAVVQTLPAAAALAADFEPAQLDRLEKRQAERAGEWRDEYLQPEPAERRAASVKRLRERAEQLYGRLDGPQRERIAQGVAASPFDAQRWLAERERGQSDLARTLRLISTGDQPVERSTEQLREVWQRIKRSPDDGYQRYQDELIPYNCALSAELHNTTSAQQRLAAQRQLKTWRSDLLQLASPG